MHWFVFLSDQRGTQHICYNSELQIPEIKIRKKARLIEAWCFYIHQYNYQNFLYAPHS